MDDGRLFKLKMAAIVAVILEEEGGDFIQPSPQRGRGKEWARSGRAWENIAENREARGVMREKRVCVCVCVHCAKNTGAAFAFCVVGRFRFCPVLPRPPVAHYACL